MRCRLISSDTQTDSVPIELPLATFDDKNVLIFVEQSSEGLLIHDGGRVVDYLADHNIMPLKRDPSRRYFHFYEDLAQKHGLRFSNKHRRFERMVEPTDGKEALIFAECLIALSFLALTKAAGLKPFSFKDAQNLTGLQMTLTAAFSSEIQVKYGLEPQIQQRPARQDWGLTLRASDARIRGCVHYLNGVDFSQVVRRALVFNEFSKMSERWFNIEPDCHWGVYGGPPKFFDDANAILADVGNGSSKCVLRMTDEESLISQITDRLGLSPDKNWQDEATRQRETFGGRLFAHEADDVRLRLSEKARPEQLLIPTALDRATLGEHTADAIESAANRFLDSAEAHPKHLRSLLDAYGLAFAERVLSEISQHANRVSLARFTFIADTFLRYYSERNDVDAVDLVDRHVAVIEERMEPLVTFEETFRREEEAATDFVACEIRSLTTEITKLLAAKGGEQ